MSRRNAPDSPTGKTSKSFNQSQSMSALYITALLFVNTALFVHLLWDSAFVQSINQSINQSLGFAYFSPSIEAFTPSLIDQTINQLTPNIHDVVLTPESLQGIARQTWTMKSPSDPSITVHPNDFEILSESIDQSKRSAINSTDLLIPNIAHFVIGATHSSRDFAYHSTPTFTIINYLSVKSAADLGGFDAISCHLLHEPVSSVYWQLAMPYCTYIEVLDLPLDRVFGRPVYHASIKAEIARLRVLLQYGGHGIEDDVIFVKPFDASLYNQIMNHELVLGYAQPARENWPDRPDVSIVSAKTTSWMLSEWLETYRMYEDASMVSEQANDGLSTVWSPDVDRWTHDLAHLLMLPRRHLVALAPVEWWGKIYARESEGRAKLYDEKTSLDQLNPATIAIHLWESERTAIREQRMDDGSIVVSSVEQPNVHQVQSFADICTMAEANLFGQVLKRAMLAGDRHTHTCD